MKLRELFEAVKEKSLTKDQLENYRDDLANLYALMKLEYAELEKKEALYLLASDAPNWTAKKVNWKCTKEGQRMIELKNYMGGTNKVIDSLKSRLYSIY